MKLATFLLLLMLVLPATTAMSGGAPSRTSPEVNAPNRTSRDTNHPATENQFDLSDFGALGDGVSDDGPALQSALDAIADAGGGTLFVPAGRYAIITPVQKDFTGRATAVTIQGVESTTPVPPPTERGDVLTRGLDLVSEFFPRTGELQFAVSISGLETFLIQDIAFIGTPGVENDALITLALSDISKATIRHCEFYGLSSLVSGGAIVHAMRSDLTFEQSVVLGSACSSGEYSSIIQNQDWKGLTISESVFADYGQREELYGKMETAPFSWVNLGNAAAPDNVSPRREAVVRSVFFDEGGFMGLTSFPDLSSPTISLIDLFYVTGVYMNVSNLGTTGNYLDGIQSVLIEKSHYGWSHDTSSAIYLLGVGNAIIDEAECVDSANRIVANPETGKLTVINSIYTHLDSQAQTTNVITTATTDEDPVQHVREQFMAILARAPDPAAHFYWSDRILQCGSDAACVAASRAALAAYLDGAPAAKFAITGRVTDGNGINLPGVMVTLSGSQSVTTTSDSTGQYHFSNLPTSGVYTVTPTINHHLLNPSSRTIVTPAGDQVFDAVASVSHHTISGRVTTATGAGLDGVTVTLSGSQNAAVDTGIDGTYSFANLAAGGNYTVSPQKTSYAFSPANQTFLDLDTDKTLNFYGTDVIYTISGRATGSDGSGLAGVVMTLSGSQTSTVTTDSTGAFAFANLPGGGNYTVIASRTSYSWTPQSLVFNELGSNQMGDFSGAFVTHNVTGRVTENGVGLSGVSLQLSGGQTSTATTDAEGNYSFTLPSESNYTITPQKEHYTFASANLTFTNLTASQTANFAATRNRHNISGRVVNVNNNGLAGITVALSGSQTATATTDSAGEYSFASLLAGGAYSVAPSLPHHSFTPASQTFTNLAARQQAAFIGNLNTHTISGKVSNANGGAIGGVLVSLSGSLGPISTFTTAADGTYSFGPLSAGAHYSVSVSMAGQMFQPSSRALNALSSNETADFSTAPRLIEFSAANYSVAEGTASITIPVTRTGDSSAEAVVTYSASNGTGTQGKDTGAVIGQLFFGPTETTRTFTIFITDDAFVEGAEQLTITLTAPQGALLGRDSATLTINDNDSSPAGSNPADEAQFFVRQHYRDFLNREPDAAGLAFWSGQIVACGTNAACVEDRRINVSAAFFLSIEFQETGFLVHRLYKASFARSPAHLNEFLLDARTIAQGIVVDAPGWQQLLEANKTAHLKNFVERPNFRTQYPLSLTPAEFVTSLNAKAGGVLSADGVSAAVAEFNGSTTSSDTVARARVLRSTAESESLSQRELSPAFVLMQYFGYLQRNPSDPPDTSLEGYNFWLSKLNEFGGDFHRAQMVKSFLVSGEYRNRFGL